VGVREAQLIRELASRDVDDDVEDIEYWALPSIRGPRRARLHRDV